MSDASLPNAAPPAPPATTPKSSLLTVDARTKRRNAAEGRFRAYGIAAIATGLVFLVLLLGSIIFKGVGAFQQTFITLDVELLEAKLDKNGNRDPADLAKVTTFGYNPLLDAAIKRAAEGGAGGVENPFTKGKDLRKLLSAGGAANQVRQFVLDNPDRIGETVTFRLLASSRVDGYFKDRVSRESLARDKNLTPVHLDMVDGLRDAGVVAKRFNLGFITGADASESRPEQAGGIGVSMLGSLFMMLVVLALSLPIGVAASIYLEEFARQNWFTDLIEVNISNLAAVPSIVFGILGGLAVFIQFAHLPQSAPPLVGGGLVLTLMTLPTIIISTRASLKSVPPSIREAALGG